MGRWRPHQQLVEHLLAAYALVLAIVKRSDDQKGFVVLPKRWITERLFAHLMQSRRLVRAYERRTTSAEAVDLLVDDHGHEPPPGEATPRAGVNRPAAGSASQPRATRRFAFSSADAVRSACTKPCPVSSTGASTSPTRERAMAHSSIRRVDPEQATPRCSSGSANTRAGLT
ncbi:transposase [Streptomyces roseochromogenus]|uniref:Transposase DDE domain-containing protein n=1 Tax=Streptomyces roseochromogenus subsp. oscitans DS 12.976 TaxID=1352936 RepID=V6KZ33_STRRC|nr:transposase [Streptomyces roseochromogenus]EST36696.1 hypothetical protein M878_00955 [Streptomyces roseochromogenus subsp. oscitans DS 12.976]